MTVPSSRILRKWRKALAPIFVSLLFLGLYIIRLNLLEIKDRDRRTRQQNIRDAVSKEETIHIMLTSDNNTIMGAMATMNSVMTNTRHPLELLHFHIVTEANFTEDFSQYIDWSILHKIKYDIRTVNSTLLQSKIRLRGGRSELAKPMNYARFLYPAIYPEVQGKFIHLDDDVIVQGDIAELYGLHLTDNSPVAFLNDCASLSAEFDLPAQREFKDYLNLSNEQVKRLKLDGKACSYNTGVFLGHMDRWRKGMYTEKMLFWLSLNSKEHVYGNEKGGGGSQPPMMLSFYLNYTPVPPQWHLQHLGSTESLVYPIEMLKTAKLLHWNGKRKPWKSDALHTRLWDRYFVPSSSDKFSPEREIEEIR